MPRWFVWTVLAVVSWGLWALLSRLIGDTLSPAQSQALSTIGLAPVIVALGLRVRLNLNHNLNPRASKQGALLAFTAGVLTCLGNIAYYHVLNSGAKAATVVPLTALYPVVTVVLAVLLLRERLAFLQVGGILCALVAIYLFNVGSARGLLSSWFLVALVPIAFWGVAGFLEKLATNHTTAEAATLWFLSAFIPVAIFILLQQPLPHELTARSWLLVSALGLAFAVGNAALLAAFAADGKASVIAPLAALYPIVSIPLAMLVFGERLGARESCAIILALAGIAAISLPAAESRSPKPRVQLSS